MNIPSLVVAKYKLRSSTYQTLRIHLINPLRKTPARRSFRKLGGPKILSLIKRYQIQIIISLALQGNRVQKYSNAGETKFFFNEKQYFSTVSSYLQTIYLHPLRQSACIFVPPGLRQHSQFLFFFGRYIRNVYLMRFQILKTLQTQKQAKTLYI